MTNVNKKLYWRLSLYQLILLQFSVRALHFKFYLTQFLSELTPPQLTTTSLHLELRLLAVLKHLIGMLSTLIFLYKVSLTGLWLRVGMSGLTEVTEDCRLSPSAALRHRFTSPPLSTPGSCPHHVNTPGITLLLISTMAHITEGSSRNTSGLPVARVRGQIGYDFPQLSIYQSMLESF